MMHYSQAENMEKFRFKESNFPRAGFLPDNGD